MSVSMITHKKLEQYEALEGPEGVCVGFLYSMDNHEDVILYPNERLEDVAYSLMEGGCFGEVGEGLSN